MNLQKAINSLFILHQAIGQLPYRIVMGEHTAFHDLREFHQKGEKLLEELASDDIPF